MYISPVNNTINRQTSFNYDKKQANNTLANTASNVSFQGSKLSMLDMFGDIYRSQIKVPLTKSEYNAAIKRQLSYMDECCDSSIDECQSSQPLYEAYIDKSANGDNELLGLASFCALHDWHEYVNNYVTNANIEYPYVYNYDKTRRANIRHVRDTVSTLDYSLARLDERYGKYEGVLYRTGIVDNNLKQYYATSNDARCTISHSGIMLPDEVKYNIIQTKSGHKLYEFQNKGGSLGKFINDGEQEILLDRKCNFRKIKHADCDEEQIKLKRELLGVILEEYDTQYGTTMSKDVASNPEKIEEYISQIDFWETY